MILDQSQLRGQFDLLHQFIDVFARAHSGNSFIVHILHGVANALHTRLNYLGTHGGVKVAGDDDPGFEHHQFFQRCYIFHGLADFLTAHVKDVGELRELRVEELASNKYFLLLSPQHNIVSALGCRHTNNLKLRISQGEVLGLPIVHCDGRFDTALTHHCYVRSILPGWHPRKQSAIAAELVGLQFSQVALFFLKILMRNDVSLSARPKAGATNMVGVGMKNIVPTTAYLKAPDFYISKLSPVINYPFRHVFAVGSSIG